MTKGRATYLYATDIEQMLCCSRPTAIKRIKEAGGYVENGRLCIDVQVWNESKNGKETNSHILIDKNNDDIVLQKVFSEFNKKTAELGEMTSFRLCHKKGRTYYMLRLYGQGKREAYVNCRTSDKDRAREIEVEIRKRLARQEKDGIVFMETASFVDEFVNHKMGNNDNPFAEGGCTPKTVSKYKTILLEATKLLPAYVCEIERKDIENYIEYLKTVNISKSKNKMIIQKNRTVADKISILNNAMNYAVKKGYCKANPVSGVAKPAKNKADIVPYSEAEVRSINMEIDRRAAIAKTDVKKRYWETMCEVFHCLNNTGMRISDVLNLKGENIISNNGVLSIHFIQKKTGRPVTINISSAYEHRLRLLLAGKNKTESVFTKHDGTVFTYDCVYSAFIRVLDAIGLHKKSPIHSFRHTVATMLINSTSLIKAAAQLGDTVDTVSKVYAHPEVPSRHELDFALGNLRMPDIENKPNLYLISNENRLDTA